MKLLITVGCALVYISSAAQTKTFPGSAIIQSYCLEVSENKTTNLIFPAAIKSVDRGSKDVLAQKAAGVENILKVKGDVKNFEETNLTVITDDGKLYSFIVIYHPHPTYQAINVEESAVIYSEPQTNRSRLAAYCIRVRDTVANIRAVKDTRDKITLTLNAIYNTNDVVFCRVSVHNATPIDYDILQFRFYIRDVEEAKRTASQEREITPLYIYGNPFRIQHHGEETWVVALPRFTVADEKYFSIDLLEKDGTRHVSIKLKNRQLMKTQIIL